MTESYRKGNVPNTGSDPEVTEWAVSSSCLDVPCVLDPSVWSMSFKHFRVCPRDEQNCVDWLKWFPQNRQNTIDCTFHTVFPPKETNWPLAQSLLGLFLLLWSFAAVLVFGTFSFRWDSVVLKFVSALSKSVLHLSIYFPKVTFVLSSVKMFC